MTVREDLEMGAHLERDRVRMRESMARAAFCEDPEVRRLYLGGGPAPP